MFEIFLWINQTTLIGNSAPSVGLKETKLAQNVAFKHVYDKDVKKQEI